MESKELYESLVNSYSTILTKERFKNVLNRGNKLIGLDVLNRLLIEMQNNSAFEVRTEEEWNTVGRVVVKGEKPIYIILPKITYEYVDTDTGKSIGSNDLGYSEKLKAVELNIIKKVEKLEYVYTNQVYDIRQTRALNGVEYTVSRLKLNIADTLNVFKEFTGAEIIQCDENYYSENENKLFISKGSYGDVVAALLDYTTQYIIKNKLESILENIVFDFKFTEEDIKLIKNSIQYSLKSMVLKNCDLDIELSESNDKNIAILNIIDTSISDFVSKIADVAGIKYSNYTEDCGKTHKASMLLDIMEANILNKKLKGL